MTTKSLACAVTGALLICSGRAHAAQWYLIPKVSLVSSYKSNLTFTTRPHNGVEELDLSPQAAFGRTTQTAGITGAVRLNTQRFWGQSGLNTNDGLFNLHLYDNGQRMGWTLDAGIIRDTTLQSELNATGLVLQRTPRVSRSLSPSWHYMINQQTQFTVSYQHQDVRYPDGASLGFKNYQINAGTTSISYQYNPRLQLFATGSMTYYRTTQNQLPFGANFKAQYDSVEAGTRYAFNQTLDASLSAGATRSTSTVTEQQFLGYRLVQLSPLLFARVFSPPFDVSSTRSGWVVNASLQKKFQTGTLNTTFSRNIQATGFGGLVETDHLQLSAAHKVSATFSESLDLGLYRTNAVTSTVSGLDRTFLILKPAITWNMTRWWHLRGSYEYARQRYQNQSETATRNAVYLDLSYTWPRIAVSR